MERGANKFLTRALVAVFVVGEVFAGSFVREERASTHLRWSLFVPEDRVLIEKAATKVVLKSLDEVLLSSVHKDLKKLTPRRDYVASVSEIKFDGENNAHYIEIETAGNEVELFFFYRKGEKRYILDYWRDGDSLKTIASAPVQPENKKTVVPPNHEVLRDVKKEEKPVAQSPREDALRDFRYGASFIWNYPAFIPKRKETINISRKTAELFYPIQDRDFKKNEREAHLQLAINLYRKKKWGLMYKALGLFQEKYGYKRNVQLIEYLKANALIREKLTKGHNEPAKEGISIYENLVEISNNYGLKKGLRKYLVEYYLEKENYVSALKNAKALYVLSKENFDYEEFKEQSDNILYFLAKLGQLDKLREVLKEKLIAKFIPSQRLLAYEVYSLLSLGRAKEAVGIYERKKASLAAPVEAAILYNVGEAYFREAKYNEAMALFDKFIEGYSFYKESERARLRMALIFDLVNKPYREVKELYRNAINRTAGVVAYEAKIRYVALTSLRQRRPKEKDVEERVFLEKEDVNKKYEKNIEQLLWLVRMRIMIVDSKFKEALSYLAAIPIASMPPSYRRAFEADGGEIVYGIIKQSYKESNYSKVVKVWRMYRDKYAVKAAKNSYLRYLVGNSLVHLGFFDRLGVFLSEFDGLKKTPEKTFPLWVEREKNFNQNTFVEELKIMADVKMGNYPLAMEGIKKLGSMIKDKKMNYWKGYIHYNKKEYEEAIKHFELFLIGYDPKIDLNVMETADLLKSYTDAVYRLGKIDKFLKISEAMLKDVDNMGGDSRYMRSVKERVRYFRIESLFGNRTQENLVALEPIVDSFLKDYPESSYGKRMEYILGLSLIKNKKERRGKEILETLLSQGNTSEIIKEMIRSELTLMKIKEVEI